MTLENPQLTPIALRSTDRVLTYDYFEWPRNPPNYTLKKHYSDWNVWETFSPGSHEVFLEMHLAGISDETDALHITLLYWKESLASRLFPETIDGGGGTIFSIVKISDMQEQSNGPPAEEQ